METYLVLKDLAIIIIAARFVELLQESFMHHRLSDRLSQDF